MMESNEHSMKPVHELLTEYVVKDLASRSNLRYGQDIVKNGQVIFEKANAFHQVAKVSFRNGETRTVDLLSTPKGLRYKCTCTSRKDLFCKHMVAAGLSLSAKNNGPEKEEGEVE